MRNQMGTCNEKTDEIFQQHTWGHEEEPSENYKLQSPKFYM